MKLTDSTRREKLYDLAGKDMVYQVWANIFADCQEAFAAFARAQPEDVRNMLRLCRLRADDAAAAGKSGL